MLCKLQTAESTGLFQYALFWRRLVFSAVLFLFPLACGEQLAVADHLIGFVVVVAVAVPYFIEVDGIGGEKNKKCQENSFAPILQLLTTRNTRIRNKKKKKMNKMAREFDASLFDKSNG